MLQRNALKFKYILYWLSHLRKLWKCSLRTATLKISVCRPGLWQSIKKLTQQRHQRLYLVENESWADLHLLMLFQRWQNNVETTSRELRRFNVDKPTLFQPWYLVENESWGDVCLSTFFIVDKTMLKQYWKNYVDSMC